ncbi:hypothetical protein BG011_006713 [Mortierella polycephala]|uniref:Uncharacterized protein n=1 Tax=Mortierella polycephala TaxID=41804 RepID=A0A9P6PU78_9FUNG|nr:hypothetical protein BG011_006713 [Mortierella polycephala]
MATAPTLPFVVLKAHKPSSANDIITAGIGQSSSSSSLSPPRPTPLDFSLTSTPPSSTAAGTTAASNTSGSQLPDTIINNAPAQQASWPSTHSRNNSLTAPATTTNTTTTAFGTPLESTTIQTRTLHPQVHYIFEDDPLEAEILESIPRSRCITLDLDPRLGTVKNVESFVSHLQVMDVKLVPFQPAPPGSSSSSLSLNSPAGNNSANDGQIGSATTITRPTVVRTASPGSSSIQSIMSTSTKLKRQPSENKLGNLMDVGGSGSGGGVNSETDGQDLRKADASSIGTAAKDWMLVIEAVESDENEQQSDSTLLEQSMISSLDTETTLENYLLRSEALLKSFCARNSLVHRVLEYSSTTGSPH